MLYAIMKKKHYNKNLWCTVCWLTEHNKKIKKNKIWNSSQTSHSTHYRLILSRGKIAVIVIILIVIIIINEKSIKAKVKEKN